MTITNEDIQTMLKRSPVVGRAKEYCDKSGMPEVLPDMCSHPDADLSVDENGNIACFRCGCRPPGIWITEE